MNILIIGASGYLGSMLYQKCSLLKTINLYGTYYSKVSNSQMLRLDIMDTKNTKNIVKNIEPDIIVWSMMNTRNELNVSEVGLVNMLSAISKNARFIYLSTMISSKSNQNEDVLPELRSQEMHLADYVNGKIRGEEIVKTHKNHVIIRPGQIWGFDVNGQPDIRMQRILEHKKTGEKYPRAINSHISIIHINDLVSCIMELFFNNYTGIINIAAERPISYYHFYQGLARMLKINDEIIVPYYAEQTMDSFFNTTKCKTVLSTQIQNVNPK